MLELTTATAAATAADTAADTDAAATATCTPTAILPLILLLFLLSLLVILLLPLLLLPLLLLLLGAASCTYSRQANAMADKPAYDNIRADEGNDTGIAQSWSGQASKPFYAHLWAHSAQYGV